MKPAIRAENLTKQYRLQRGPRGGTNLTESLIGGARAAWGRVRALLRPQTDDGTDAFWALNGVSFDVAPGEVVGVIGRNGAGKSTLLKVLARIVEPSGGRAEVRGRMGSLLEVGTGFHPELTGRENVFLNGSILGMSRREIARKFDAIVAFAEVNQFLDTPVKRYSSGMYVRLAFAVAAHMEPEILVIDEALSVGDATFQRRCIDRMAELARSGATILFVTHNMQLIPEFCQRAILLDRGRVIQQGDAGAVTRAYLDRLVADARTGDLQDKPRTGDGRARFVRAWLTGADGQPVAHFTCGDDLIVRMVIDSRVTVAEAAAAVVITTQHGTRVITSWTREIGPSFSLRPGLQEYECRFQAVSLRPGHTVLIHLWLSDGEVLDFVDNAVVVDVVGNEQHRHLSPDGNQGIVVFDYSWRKLSEG
jgi:lipopolysaccharide transport system ATP-binding protein